VGKKSVVVHIAGQRYVVRSDADETYLQQLAGFVNDRIAEVTQNTSKPVSSQNLTVLAALNIADDLFRERKKREVFKESVREKSRTILRYLDKEVENLQNHK
jgi:cell division protein ZapA